MTRNLTRLAARLEAASNRLWTASLTRRRPAVWALTALSDIAWAARSAALAFTRRAGQ